MKKHICGTIINCPADVLSHSLLPPFGSPATILISAVACSLYHMQQNYVFVIIQIKLLTGYSCLIASSAGISTAFDAG